MKIFSEVVRQAAVAVRAGRNVRVVGSRMSGRTTVFRAVVEALEASGMKVLQASGDRASAQQPGYVLEQIRSSLSFTPKSRDLISLVDAFAQATSARDVVAIDNLHLADALSLHVLSAARDRVGFQVLVTEVTGRARHDDFPPIWPETLIRVPELDLATSALLLQDILGDPIEPRAHAQIYGKVGGNVGLTIALAESAKHDGLLELHGAHWKARGRRLWNSNLTAVLDGLLAELEPEERDLVVWLAEAGPTPVERVLDKFPESVLRRVVAQNYAASFGGQRDLVIQVWPPILSSRHQQSSMLAAPEPDSEGGEISAAASAPGNALAALAKGFAEHEERFARETFRTWRAVPTVPNALAYFAVALGMEAETERVRRVFEQTPTSSRLGSSAEQIGYAIRRIQWLRFGEGNQEASDRFLEQLVVLNPGLEATLKAANRALQVMDGSGVPEVEKLGEALPENEFELAGWFACALARGDLNAVEEGVELAKRLPDSGFLEGYIAPTKLFLEGHVRESLRVALAQREVALKIFDRSQYCALSYAAAVAAQHIGAPERMRQYLSEGIVVGAPSSALSMYYGAFFCIESAAAHFNGQLQLRDNLQREAATRLPEIGPYLGMGLGLLNGVIHSSEDPEEFENTVADIVDRSLQLRYNVSAIQSAVTGLTIHWSAGLARSFLKAYGRAMIPGYAFAAEATRLIDEGEVQELKRWGGSLSPTADDVDMLVRLLGAAFRWARQAGNHELSDVLEQIVSLTLLPNKTDQDRRHGLADLLSQREQEIGLLAGELSNPEISERLGISRRTVENHIANALKKTKLPNRRELAQHLGGVRQ